MAPAVQLLLIDPQNDFCDLPPAACPPGAGPALPVPGADADMHRLANFIDRAGDAIDGITVTLDSHHRLDVAHPTFWRTGSGAAVAPFTPFSAADVRAGSFQPRDPAALARTLAYLDELERRGRYQLMVWPVHCEIGTWGHNVHDAVRAAYGRWEERRLAVAHKVAKGSNPWTEHYSAVQAEVPDDADADTQLNTGLIARLDEADTILVAGEASSHCVKATVEHLMAHLPSGRMDKLVLLADCMSPVAGFGAQAAAFLDTARARGARVTTSLHWLAALQPQD